MKISSFGLLFLGFAQNCLIKKLAGCWTKETFNILVMHLDRPQCPNSLECQNEKSVLNNHQTDWEIVASAFERSTHF